MSNEWCPKVESGLNDTISFLLLYLFLFKYYYSHFNKVCSASYSLLIIHYSSFFNDFPYFSSLPPATHYSLLITHPTLIMFLYNHHLTYKRILRFSINSQIIPGFFCSCPCTIALGQMAPVGQACRHLPQEVQVTDSPQGVSKSEMIRTW